MEQMSTRPLSKGLDRKKTILMLAVIAALMAIAVAAAASDEADAESSGNCGNDLTWFLDDEGNLTISGTGNMQDWFDNTAWVDVQSVTIDEGVTSIGASAFDGCYSLASVSIPS